MEKSFTDGYEIRIGNKNIPFEFRLLTSFEYLNTFRFFKSTDYAHHYSE